MKYRKKPIVIEAIQFTRDNIEKIREFANNNISIWIPKCPGGIMTGDIKTLEGTIRATENDYIIKGINGEIYPCKPDIFELTYEKVE